MKGYKGFSKGLVCRGKQYAEHTIFEEDSAKICEYGMHFCENPLDVLDYYPLIDNNGEMNEFAEVEALSDVHTDDGKKFCTTRLKVGAKITIPRLVQLGGEFLRKKITHEVKTHAANSGYYAKQVGGNYAKQVGGNYAKQVGGNYAKQVGGYYAQQVGGDYAQQVGGNSAQQVGADYAKQVGGDYAQQVGGYYAKQVGGYYAQQVGGKNAIMVSGEGSQYKAGLHSLLIAYWYGKDGNLAWKTAQIDGETLKPDTWYTLKDGEFVEVEG